MQIDCGGGTVIFSVIIWLVLCVIIILYGKTVGNVLWWGFPGLLGAIPFYIISYTFCSFTT